MKASKFTLLATIAVLFTPVAAFAEGQVSIQDNSHSAAAVGTGNLVIQDTTQMSDQTQLDIGGYGYDTPDAQTSIQMNSSEAAAIGHGNTIIQDTDQRSEQTQVDIDRYLSF